MEALREAVTAADNAAATATAANEAVNKATLAAAISFSRYSWIAATEAAHPPSAEWTARDKAEAEAAWGAWFKKLRPDTEETPASKGTEGGATVKKTVQKNVKKSVIVGANGSKRFALFNV